MEQRLGSRPGGEEGGPPAGRPRGGPRPGTHRDAVARPVQGPQSHAGPAQAALVHVGGDLAREAQGEERAAEACVRGEAAKRVSARGAAGRETRLPESRGLQRRPERPGGAFVLRLFCWLLGPSVQQRRVTRESLCRVPRNCGSSLAGSFFPAL